MAIGIVNLAGQAAQPQSLWRHLAHKQTAADGLGTHVKPGDFQANAKSELLLRSKRTVCMVS